MAARYQAVLWNANKRRYDVLLLVGLVGYLGVFFGIGMATKAADTSPPILLIRAFGTAAFTMLHLILMIGPLARLFPETFSPILYNRRHFGVAFFLVALAHAIVAVGWYHGFGTMNPLVSLLTNGGRWDGTLTAVPFEVFGLGALVIVFVMAATSHDFWLANLGAAFWKALHMGVYLAYGLLLAHVLLGVVQDDKGGLIALFAAAGFVLVAGLHLLSAFWGAGQAARVGAASHGAEWVDVAAPDEIEDGRAKVVAIDGGERIAVWRDGNRVFATSNVCAHQAGPLGEGRILDGCITCPWHGYQYRPENGTSPPPYTEKIPTYRTRIEAGRIYVNKTALAPGSHAEPSLIA